MGETDIITVIIDIVNKDGWNRYNYSNYRHRK